MLIEDALELAALTGFLLVALAASAMVSIIFPQPKP